MLRAGIFNEDAAASRPKASKKKKIFNCQLEEEITEPSRIRFREADWMGRKEEGASRRVWVHSQKPSFLYLRSGRKLQVAHEYQPRQYRAAAAASAGKSESRFRNRAWDRADLERKAALLAKLTSVAFIILFSSSSSFASLRKKRKRVWERERERKKNGYVKIMFGRGARGARIL